MMLGLCRGIWYLWAILGTFAKYGEFLPILGHPQQQIRHGLALGKHKRINACVAYICVAYISDTSDISVPPLFSSRGGNKRRNAYVAYITDISDVSVTPSSTRWGLSLIHI